MTPFFALFHHPRAGILLLRWYVALAMLLHGVAKLGKGVDGIAGMLGSQGVPGFLAYAVFLGEIVAPLFVLAGRWVTPAALVMAVNMVVAIALAHSGQIFTLGKSGGWAIELQGFFLVGSLVIAMTAAPRKG